MKWFKSFINSFKKILTEIKNFFPQEVETIEDFIKNVKEKKCKEIIISPHRTHISSLIHDENHTQYYNAPYQHLLGAVAHSLEGKEILFEQSIGTETVGLREDDPVHIKEMEEINKATKIAAQNIKEVLSKALPTVLITIDLQIEPEHYILTEAAS